jgi:serine/threonine-protein kinase HipA
LNQLSLDILQILASNYYIYISRSEIESKLERVSKRAILNELKLFQIQKKSKLQGKVHKQHIKFQMFITKSLMNLKKFR